MIARLQVWAGALVAMVLALLSVFGIGRLRGARIATNKAGDRAASSERAEAIAKRDRDDALRRAEVEADVLHRTNGGTTPVEHAVPGSAAEQLRDEWSRD